MLKKEANFDPLAYFEQLAGKNRLCKSKGFMPVFCSGPDNIEGIMSEYRKKENFIVIDDMTDNIITSPDGSRSLSILYGFWQA